MCHPGTNRNGTYVSPKNEPWSRRAYNGQIETTKRRIAEWLITSSHLLLHPLSHGSRDRNLYRQTTDKAPMSEQQMSIRFVIAINTPGGAECVSELGFSQLPSLLRSSAQVIQRQQ